MVKYVSEKSTTFVKGSKTMTVVTMIFTLKMTVTLSQKEHVYDRSFNDLVHYRNKSWNPLSQFDKRSRRRGWIGGGWCVFFRIHRWKGGYEL